MHWKRFRPFILELVIFCFITILLIFAVILDHITIRWSVLSVLFAIMLLLWAVQYIFGFVLRSIRALFDYITKSYDTVTAEFLQQFIFRSFSMLDKTVIQGMDHNVTETDFYKIAVKTKDEILILITAEFFELQAGKQYKITYGRKSKIIVNITR